MKNKIWLLLSISALQLSALYIPVSRADLLDNIKSKKEIIIATEARYAPFEMIEDGKIVGLGKDILTEVMKGLPGVKVVQLDIPFQGILPGLESKRFDFIATSLTITRDREEKFAFTVPFSDASVAILKRKGDSRINSPKDLQGMIVGSQAGAPQIAELEAYETSVLKPVTGHGVKEIKAFIDYNEAYAALAAHRVDAVVQSLPNLAPLVKTRGDIFEIVRPPFGSPTWYAWAGRKDADSASLVKFISDGIVQLNKSGKLAQLQKKWLGFSMDVPQQVPTPTN